MTNQGPQCFLKEGDPVRGSQETERQDPLARWLRLRCWDVSCVATVHFRHELPDVGISWLQKANMHSYAFLTEAILLGHELTLFSGAKSSFVDMIRSWAMGFVLCKAP